MTYLVAFDDSPLSRGALRKAVEYAGPSNSEVIAVTVIPKANVSYYREKRWIDQTDRANLTARMQEATADAIRKVLRGRVERIVSDVQFDPIVADQSESTTASVGKVLRTAITDHAASDVFVGARDPTRLVSALIDPRDPKYHLHMIRRPYIPESRLAQYS